MNMLINRGSKNNLDDKMQSQGAYLLPLFNKKIIRKKVRAVDEKTLVVLLFLTSLMSLFVIFKNLPPNDLFTVPKVNINKVYHLNEKDHELHHRQQVPPAFYFDRNKMKKDTIRNVSLHFVP